MDKFKNVRGLLQRTHEENTSRKIQIFVTSLAIGST